ncbi:MAG: type III secretion system chaperone [Chromatiaceae bacterium]|nr:type III secretion system chaperone [Chromatiaceae bacterium]MCP5315863.1 type III secretion system chaperone [Chromatiaceae bacterium]
MNEGHASVLEQWVAAINEQFGTRFEAEDPEHLFLELEHGRRIGVELPDGGPHYTLFTTVGLLSDPGQLRRLLVALEMNLYQRATAGGVIGLDSFTGALAYSFSFPVDQGSAELLAQQIEHFAEIADAIQGQLDKVASGDDYSLEAAGIADELGLVPGSEIDAEESGDHLSDDKADAGERPLIKV